MKIWICYAFAFLILIMILLVIKIYLLQKAAREIHAAFCDKLRNETNTLIDISSRDKYMRTLASELNTELDTLYTIRRRFQQGDIELKEAITNISHDLKTPLTATFGYLDLLKSEEKSDLANQYLDKIENRTLALKQLAEELFQYTVVSSEEDSLPLEAIAVNGVLEESISAYYVVLKKHKIMPHILISEKKIIRNLNKNALSRVFENILNNAVKYSDGDLTITLSDSGKITFSNHAADLSETQVAKLFDRFYTVNSARQSTGLGLSISKLLVEQMNGKISACYQDNVISISIEFIEV